MTDEDDAIAETEYRPTLTPKTEGVLKFQGLEIKTATMQNNEGFVVLRSLCDADQPP